MTSYFKPMPVKFKAPNCKMCKHFISPNKCNIYKYVVTHENRSDYFNIDVNVCRKDNRLCAPEGFSFVPKEEKESFNTIPKDWLYHYEYTDMDHLP